MELVLEISCMNISSLVCNPFDYRNKNMLKSAYVLVEENWLLEFQC